MQRITEKQIESALARLNTATNSPAAAYVRDADGVYTAQVGNWHASGAYGGVQLQRMHNTSGGVASFGGYGTKRELYERIHAMLDGLRVASTLSPVNSTPD